MENTLILDNYLKNIEIIKYLEKNSFIVFNTNKVKYTILFHQKQYNYFMNVKEKFKGKLQICPVNNFMSLQYMYILEIYDYNILEYLSLIYENKIHKKKQISELYNDYVKLYNNQLSLIKNNNKYYI